MIRTAILTFTLGVKVLQDCIFEYTLISSVALAISLMGIKIH